MIAGIVLAAGGSTRFGATKQIALLRERPLVQHAIDALQLAGVRPVVLVLGHDAEAVASAAVLPPEALTVVNERWAEGQAGSLAAGLSAVADSEAAVVLLADQPGITAEHVRALIEGFRTDPAPIVRLRFGDGPGPALLARSIYAEASSLEGDTGARALVAARPGDVHEVEVEGNAPRDVDTREDLGSA